MTVCDANLARLETVKGEVVRAHEQLERELRMANDRLNSAAGAEQSAQAQLKALHADIVRIQNAMRQHRDRLAELEGWWWVPGYGAYLGIRELVDHDAQRLVSLQSDLRSTDQQAHQAVQRAEAARELARQLQSTIDRTNAQEALLDRIERDLFARIAAFHTLDDFVHDANLLVDEIESILDIQVAAAMSRVASDLRRVMKRADTPTATPQVLRAHNVASLSDALSLLADKTAQDALVARLEAEDCEVADRPEDWRRAIDGLTGVGPSPVGCSAEDVRRKRC